MTSRTRQAFFWTITAFLVSCLFFFVLLPTTSFDLNIGGTVSYLKDGAAATSTIPEAVIIPKKIHLEKPEAVKAIYISSWSAGSSRQMKRLIELIERTELNTVIIDIKDDTGEISFHVNDLKLKEVGSESNRISDIDGLIEALHSKNIYVIGRVSTFQDPYFAKKHPELAVIRKSDGKTWRDRKGLSWLDAGAPETWDYLVSIAKESYSRGFDEINFDYIRFPTDGDMANIAYRFYDAKTMTKVAQMKLFYQYIDEQLSGLTPNPLPKGEWAKKQNSEVNSLSFGEGKGGAVSYIPHSADLFGMTTTAPDDMGIGQIFAEALPYFDYVCPMIYPSHYGPGVNNYKNPATHPYEMVTYALKGAFNIASSTRQSFSKVRPWLQDFSLATTYDASMVRAQIKATEDAGLTSWILWDPGNRYTEAALEKE